MSYLLALCEQFRLQRKISTLTAKQIRASHRKERMTKQIERVQKMYQKRHKKVQDMAQLMQKQFQLGIQNKFGLGTNGWNPMMGMAGQLNNGCFYQALASVLGSSKDVYAKDKDGNDTSQKIFTNLTQEQFNAIQIEEQAGTLSSKKTYIDGNESNTDKYNIKYGEGQYTWDQINTYQQAKSMAQQATYTIQNNANNMTTMFGNNVSVWLEAAEAELEAQEDAEVMPLQEQELEWDLESQSADVQLADCKERLERIKQLVQDGTKNNAPTFGLG